MRESQREDKRVWMDHQNSNEASISDDRFPPKISKWIQYLWNITYLTMSKNLGVTLTIMVIISWSTMTEGAAGCVRGCVHNINHSHASGPTDWRTREGEASNWSKTKTCSRATRQQDYPAPRKSGARDLGRPRGGGTVIPLWEWG